MKTFFIALIFSIGFHTWLLWGEFGNENNAKLVKIKVRSQKVNIKNAEEFQKHKVNKDKKAEKKTFLKNNSDVANIITKNAKAINQIKTVYPFKSRLLKETGRVSISVLIAPNGRVKEHVLTKKSEFERLNESVIKSVKETKFEAAINNAGDLVEQWLTLEFEFKLNGENP